ncbi:monosaccharide ABC transporter membrane protein, CUT2 family [Alicyclobacillus hesperidum]|uniref:Monosaccharide ABC transporter membrane protein, CUT2 family n=1 Tax=Alicyclobacillus hesperidum TaxID=89784 RepID=A0A1H2YIP7_9BACL|nr:monosaccharide ABC transporter membrane protein, CUT2 family [Alicyclobacillus hesperidum]
MKSLENHQLQTASGDIQAREFRTSWFRKLTKIREFTILLVIVVLVVVMAIMTPSFLSVDNIVTTILSIVMTAIVSVGMTVALVSGGFDLSVGSVMSMAGVVTGSLALNGMNIWLAAIFGLVASVCSGIVTGLFIGKVKINPFIMTLGMQGVIQGVAYVVTQGAPLSVTGVSNSFLFLGQGNILGIPVLIWILAVIVVVSDIILRRAVSARKVYYIGSNESAAFLSGIRVSRVKVWIYIFTALLAGISGILTLSRFSVAAPTAGQGMELQAIAACIIGGASLSGGEGTVLGALLGSVLVGIVNDALVLLNVSVYWQSLVTGFVLIAAVTLDVLAHRKKAS